MSYDFAIRHFYNKLIEADTEPYVDEPSEHNQRQVKALKALLKREMEGCGVIEEYIDNVVIRIEDNELIIEE
jgi:hypothetical protein